MNQDSELVNVELIGLLRLCLAIQIAAERTEILQLDEYKDEDIEKAKELMLLDSIIAHDSEQA